MSFSRKYCLWWALAFDVLPIKLLIHVQSPGKKYYFGMHACLCLNEKWKETLLGETQFKIMLALFKKTTTTTDQGPTFKYGGGGGDA